MVSPENAVRCCMVYKDSPQRLRFSCTSAGVQLPRRMQQHIRPLLQQEHERSLSNVGSKLQSLRLVSCVSVVKGKSRPGW